MGMESYNLLFLHENSRIVYNERNCWKISGTSGLPVSQVQNLLKETCKQITEEEWRFDECIDLLIYEEDSWFQGLELRGCLAYFDKGVEQCYACYKRWSETIPLQIYVMHQPVQVANCSEFHNMVAEAYAEKIEWFRRQYGDIEWKVTGDDAFYREVRRRQSLWYRLSRYFHGKSRGYN